MRLVRICTCLAAIPLSGALDLATTSTDGRGEKNGHGRPAEAQDRAVTADPRLFDEVLGALKVMQDNYFEPWQGTWPDAIDWTAAVVGTHVSGALSSLSHALNLKGVSSPDDKERENLVALYFSQVLGFYFGQNDVALRGQAFDDMLWVVLGWLETVKFVNLHTHLYYPSGAPRALPGQQQLMNEATGRTYFGNVWTPAFAHRARIFWELAAKGWDTRWCGGGMNWNPRLQVYKNAITNELFVAASIAMYEHFPGDDNDSPFSLPGGRRGGPHERQNPKHLDAALAGYIWLRESGMRNGPGQHPEGLYVDGFHISGWNDPKSNNTACDVRNSMVYTYNQGVILSGLRGLWRVRGNESYIREGHQLIRDVIRATGYDLSSNRPIDNLDDLRPGQLPPWRGMGRAGVLEDQCDVTGGCSQDSQTFKGIFFHHLVAFCVPLESGSLAQFHVGSCIEYRGWVYHNARAARATRDAKGKFGMWWTAGLIDISSEDVTRTHASRKGNKAGRKGKEGMDEHAVDYRSYGVPGTSQWVPADQLKPAPDGPSQEDDTEVAEEVRKPVAVPEGQTLLSRRGRSKGSDPNSRGRGRTVETQTGGLAVLRAAWEFSNLR